MPPERTAARIPILMYHRIGEPLDDADRKYCVRPADFVRQMRDLAEHGHRAVSLDAFFVWLDGGEPLPEGAFVLTFDDGFRGVYQHAFPWLRQAGWPCTVFLVSGLIGGRDAWNAPSGLGTSELLGRDEILEMARYQVRFESHTRTHAHLPQLSDEGLAGELCASRSDLESLLGQPVRYLAYPFGETDARVIDAARRAGYAGGCSSQPGFNGRAIDRFRIRRLDVYGTDTARALRRKIEFGTNDGAMLHELGYKARRLWRRVSPIQRPG